MLLMRECRSSCCNPCADLGLLHNACDALADAASGELLCWIYFKRVDLVNITTFQDAWLTSWLPCSSNTCRLALTYWGWSIQPLQLATGL